MKKIINFFENLQFIFKPRYWIMLGKYDKQWDAKLNEMVKEHDFKSETHFQFSTNEFINFKFRAKSLLTNNSFESSLNDAANSER